MKKMTGAKVVPWIVVLTSGALLSAGCATKRYVNDGLSAQDAKIADVETQVEDAQRRIAEAGEKIVAVDGKAIEAQRIGKDAGTKAGEALTLARGKLLYKVVLSDVAGRFALNKWDLSPESKAKLDEMAVRLKSENANVYLEIEGHTDSTGEEPWNLQLGQQRAETVRRYLNMQHGIPLHRMAIISYGESKPVADNSSQEGRAQNRRVEVKVLS